MTDDEKRYNLVISQEKWREVKRVADREGLPVAAVMRRFIDLGLIASSPTSRLFLSTGSGPRKRVRMFRKDDDENTLSLGH
jgi:16S rRNA U516 pseudouridylate synthase RsuA-like enzyme